MPRWLKLLVTMALVVVLIMAVDWSALPEDVSHISGRTLALSFIGYAIQFVTSAWKWQWALRVHDVDLPLLKLLRIYCVSHFVGQFLPTAIGGDAYRLYRTMPMCSPSSRAVSSVVVDRVLGLATLLGIGTVAAWTAQDDEPIATLYLLASCAGIAAIGMLWYLVRHHRVQRLAARAHSHPWGRAIADNFSRMRSAGPRWLGLIFTSLLFQIIAVAILWSIFVAIGANVSLAECAIIAAVAGLATLVPLSINGIGIVDGSIAGMAVIMGADYDQGLLVAVISRLLVLPQTLTCGLIYLTEPSVPRRQSSANS